MKWFVKLKRDILDLPFSSNLSLLGFYAFLLMKVNHKYSEFYLWSLKIELQPWEAVVSQKKLADRFNVSISTIHRRIKLLISEWLLESKWQSKFTLVKIVEPKSIINNEKQIETNKKYTLLSNKSNSIVSILISKLKMQANILWVTYDPTDEYHYSQLIICSESINNLKSERWMTIEDLCCDIMQMSQLIGYRKWVCSWPKLIYTNYVEVLNKTSILLTDEIDSFIFQQNEPIKSRLFLIKKERAKKYPYKKPFSSIEQVKEIILAIKQGKV